MTFPLLITPLRLLATSRLVLTVLRDRRDSVVVLPTLVRFCVLLCLKLHNYIVKLENIFHKLFTTELNEWLLLQPSSLLVICVTMHLI